jgi:AraC-like DNA-binding protein
MNSSTYTNDFSDIALMSSDVLLLLNNAFLVIGSFLGLVLSITLIKNSRWKQYANIMLSIYLLGIASACLLSFLITNKLIFYFPWMFRLPSPLHHWMFPAGLLYVYLTLNHQNKIPTWGWLLLVPGLIHLVEMLPFYLKSNEYKISYIKELQRMPMLGFGNSEGWLPQYMHNQIRALLGTGCGISAMVLIFRYRKNHPGLAKQFPGLTRWLVVFASMMLVFGLMLLVTFVINGNWKSPQLQSRILTISFSLSLIITTTYLIFNPGFLYGMPRLELETENGTDKNRNIVSNDQNEDEGIRNYQQQIGQQIENFILSKQVYLKPDYKISDLARDTGIPEYHISQWLNKCQHIRFTSYIHGFRIKYIEDAILQDGKKMSLEGLAKSAGFASRATFHRTIVQLTGKTPSEYFFPEK